MEINNLSLEEKIGQMLMVGIEGKKITSRTRDLIEKYKVGGIILYKKNFSTYSEMVSLIKELKDINKINKIPLFIAIDQEGGRVNRMPQDLLNLPPAGLIANKLGIDGVKEAAEITGEILEKTGFNMNFAPVADLRRTDDSKVVGDRSFGRDKKFVADCAVSQIKEFQQHNIIPVIKHFPGHGATKDDSHFKLPTISSSIENLQDEDMYPFGQAIENGVDAVLVGHLRIKNVTNTFPCSLSRKFIIKYLRKKYHYNGLIISDDLKMKAVRYRYGTVNSAIRAVNSGNDIIIFRFKQTRETKTIETLIKLAKENKLNNYKIDMSVNRILKIKANLCDNTNMDELDLQNINKKIAKIRNDIYNK